MVTELGRLLADKRAKLHLSLRDVERQTGVHNAHLSQIERGTIERPDPNILWELSALYRVEFQKLMRLAGHVQATTSSPSSGRLLSIAFHALEGLEPSERNEVLRFIEKLKQAKPTVNEDES